MAVEQRDELSGRDSYLSNIDFVTENIHFLPQALNNNRKQP